MSSQPSSVSTRSIVASRRRARRRASASSPARDRPRRAAAFAARSTASSTAGAPQVNVTPCRSTRRRISAPSTLRSMTWLAPIAVERVWQPPAVAVEQRLGLQVDVAGAQRRGASRCSRRCSQSVAVGELHALRPGCRARGVVDRRGRVLVGLPRGRLIGGRREQLRVSAPSSTMRCFAPDIRQASSSSGSISNTSAPE